MRKVPILALLFTPVVTLAQGAATPAATAPPAISEKIAGMKHFDGFIPMDWDAQAGKLYLEVPHMSPDGRTPDLLYTNSLPYGTGSNDLGLDRGQLSRGRIVRFERSGPKVLLVEPNLAFRTSSNDPDEQLAVTQSFPESVLWGFTMAAESPGAVLIDATDFFLHDAHGITDTLTVLNQGAYHVDASRSTIALDDTRAFPKSRPS
jgi:hypothetical protein